MGTVGFITESLDQSTLRAIMIRLRLAQMHLNNAPGTAEDGRLAIEMLIRHDLPVLLREIVKRKAGSV